MNFQAKWITTENDLGDVCPSFRRIWNCDKPVKEARLMITALGVYKAWLNGKPISDYVLAPGWTSYNKRLQYQEYDITDMIQAENKITVTVGKGWFRSRMADFAYPKEARERRQQPCGLIAELYITYKDGSKMHIISDESWEYSESPIRFSEIYDGEIFDAGYTPTAWNTAVLLNWSKEILIPQEGLIIKEMERIQAKEILRTPKGETVVDFGQEITGYIEFTTEAKKGEEIHILHGEMLDAEGNFYNENYRSAKAEIIYFCKEGLQTWHPELTFFGFRYIKLNRFPGAVNLNNFTAIVVHSDMKRTGYLTSSHLGLNRLISNIFWGQKGNFLDLPTDCPQRDERLGWTGDAQVFVKTASYNYDVESFFRKWLRDLAAEQYSNGGVSTVVPNYMQGDKPSAGWGDAAVICPWQIYLTYGNKDILEEQFESMKKWVDYITNETKDRYLWTGGVHFGDWLGLDNPAGSYRGASREDLIASAFYAYSTEILIKAGKVLGKDMTVYEHLHNGIVEEFRKKFPEYRTQTEHVLAVRFSLAKDLRETVDDLAAMIQEDGIKIRTGFIGTPYILHVLSEYGHADLAWSLLLRRETPSWLFSVEHGATTMWEHWDGIMPDGTFWSSNMNSFNHYAYGAVADWIYEAAAGIRVQEEYPGFSKVRIEPHPDRRLRWLSASINTRNGLVASKWIYGEDGIRYEITAEMPLTMVINGIERELSAGKYIFWDKQSHICKRGEEL